MSLLSQQISICFMTNCTYNAPSIKKQKNTIESVYTIFNIKEVLPTFIFIDSKPNKNMLNDYLQNLLTIPHLQNSKVIYTVGLPDGYLKIIENISTPYVLFLEHDWTFTNIEHSLDEILRWFDNDKTVNCVLFNKRNNIIAGDDKKLKNHYNLPLTLTNRQSNNPNIFRVSFAKEIKSQLIKKKERCSIHKMQDNCQGIECEFQNYVGCEPIRIQQFGTHLYGYIGNHNTLNHLDGRS